VTLLGVFVPEGTLAAGALVGVPLGEQALTNAAPETNDIRRKNSRRFAANENDFLCDMMLSSNCHNKG
jgi:hypothetical protein